MVVGELAHALGEDVLGVAAGALGAGQLFVTEMSSATTACSAIQCAWLQAAT